jgi:protein-disulfide isomerase
MMTMKWLGWLSTLGIAAVFNACLMKPSSAPPSAAEQQQMGQRVEGYFRKAANLPADVTLKLTDIKPASEPGLLTATLEAARGSRKQQVPLVLTRDGRFMMQGKLVDLTVDPFKLAMEKISLKDVPMRGNPNAKVTIVEFSDFECPFCGRAYHTVEDEVMKNYGDKVRLVYKNFPLSNIHPWADSGAMAAACAREQSPEAFWKMYNFLFSNQANIKPDNVKEKVVGEAKTAGLDVAKFTTCFDNKAALPLIKAEQKEAEALGVRSTPTFFINGHKLEGALPYSQFKTVIDEELGGAPQAGAAKPAASNGQTPPGGVHPG